MKKILFSWFSKLFGSRPRENGDLPDFYHQILSQLREDIEHRIQVALAEARAFAEEHDGMSTQRSFERIEVRSYLASSEAKAYADEAIGALAKSLGATAKMTLHLSRRIDAIEEALNIEEDESRQKIRRP